MTERLFGIETEYGVSASTAEGEALEAGAVTVELMKTARRRLACLPALNQSGLFLANGSRLYVDCGAHPELATPEVTTPAAAVTYVAAGERILGELAAEVARARQWRVTVFRSNVDYDSGVTFGRHESYLHAADSQQLADQLLPHIVSRVVYGGGGFHPKSQGLEFSLSPRSAFFTSVISENSTAHRGIIHTKQEPLCGPGQRRFHVICPGDTLLSQTGIYLQVATTALLVALVEAGERPGDAVRLTGPVAALRTFAADPTCRNEARLEQGGSAGAIAIQRHYLEWVERCRDHPVLPPWTGAACARWKSVLDRLERGPEAAAGTLDWATKRTVYGRYAEQRGFDWDSLALWSETVHSLHLAMKHANVKALSCEEALATASPIKDAVNALTPGLLRRGEPWSRLRRFIDLRQEFFELDTKWGQLDEAGIWTCLETEGVLAHRIPEAPSIAGAVGAPPSIGRAKIRGEFIREVNADGPAEFLASWDRVVDERAERFLDLSNPFATERVWRPAPRAGVESARAWLEMLRRETGFAGDQPGVYRELISLAQLIELPNYPRELDLLMRRAVEIVEAWFAPDHALVAACLRHLGSRRSSGSLGAEDAAMRRRADAIVALNECRQTAGENDAEVALKCNDLAICLRSIGRAAQAEPFLREAIAIEERALPVDHPKRPHRLNNLASVLLMQDKREETRALLHRAWQLQSGRHDLTSARILCLRIALEWSCRRRAITFMGQLKTLLTEPELSTQANISTTWDVAEVWGALRPHLSEDRLALLQRISEALNDRAGQAALEEYPLWRDCPLIALDANSPKNASASARP